MIKIVGVQFRGAGKVYSFNAGELTLPVGTGVIVETAQGEEYGLVVTAARSETEENAPTGLKPVLRIATEEDLVKVRQNEAREDEAFRICAKKIEEHKLDMKLVDAEYAFDNSKILFYFTSDDRVDFRELVKDLAGTFRMRIELRQIGVRDEARTLGGLGICGRPFCCSSFLADFQPVSIKMAKEQGLSLNPTKISGTCGRLMCCLKYEQDAYEDLIRRTAPIGSYVQTPEGNGYVADYHLLTGVLKVKMDGAGDVSVRVFKNDDVTVLKRPERRKDGKKEKEPKEAAPEVTADKPVEPAETKQPRKEQRPLRSNNGNNRPNRAENGEQPIPRQPKAAPKIMDALLMSDAPAPAPRAKEENRENRENGQNRRRDHRGYRNNRRNENGEKKSETVSAVDTKE